MQYRLSGREAALYKAVTDYVREEFNRADQLLDDRRRGNVGFALTVLQRRLASSPEAIYQSLRRRRQRLQAQRQALDDLANRRQERSGDADAPFDWESYEEAPAEEAEELEEMVMDSATAALTLAELAAEIATLERLEAMAHDLCYRFQTDRKWEQLAALLQDDTHMQGPGGQRRKLVIFTEHRDTLRYLSARIATLFGREENLVFIDGSLSREARRAVEDRFRNDPDVHFLLATDAAGEGINLQRAHLMINYDLPWNPNRLEQRFGRIHRIGQTEVCHLWNLVAADTREGYVYERLLRKLEAEGQALNGQVFDVLGQLFQQTPLRQLLIEAVRYGDQPAVRARLEQTVDNAVDRQRVRELVEARSLAAETLDLRQIERIRADMERYAARRLQPHYIQSFFLEAFALLGGAAHEREPGRFRVTHVPALLRDHARAIGVTLPVQRQYERICFDKALIEGPPLAQFICPGHPLLDTVVDLIQAQYHPLLRAGAYLVDPTDPGTTPRALFFLQQTIRDAAQRPVSREVHFVEVTAQDDGLHLRDGGFAPYLDYRPPTEAERAVLADGVTVADAVVLETHAISYTIENLIPAHLLRVRQRRESLIDKTLAAVQERLTKEINYWDQRAAALRRQEREGRPNARLNSALAQQRADELAARLARRKQELAQERQLSAAPPVIVGGALVLPLGMFGSPPPDILDRRITEALAMQAVMQAEIALGHYPQDVSGESRGYDIESLEPQTGRLRFIEVKGRRMGAETVTVTRNEILTGINSDEQFILALVEVAGGQAQPPRYVRQPFDPRLQPGFEITSVNFDLPHLVSRSAPPS